MKLVRPLEKPKTNPRQCADRLAAMRVGINSAQYSSINCSSLPNEATVQIFETDSTAICQKPIIRKQYIQNVDHK